MALKRAVGGSGSLEPVVAGAADLNPPWDRESAASLEAVEGWHLLEEMRLWDVGQAFETLRFFIRGRVWETIEG